MVSPCSYSRTAIAAEGSAVVAEIAAVAGVPVAVLRLNHTTAVVKLYSKQGVRSEAMNRRAHWRGLLEIGGTFREISAFLL